MEVEVIRSTRRKKTVYAAIRDGRILVRIPQKMSRTEEKHVVDEMAKKLLARHQAETLNSENLLRERVQKLNNRFFAGKLKIKSVRFVTNQSRSFGTCSYKTAEIRISHRLCNAPLWVLDYVLVHELAHLIHPDHSKNFWKCVYRYPLTERARGYLIAKSLEDDDAEYNENNYTENKHEDNMET